MKRILYIFWIDQSFFRCLTSEYFFPVCGLFFRFLNSGFHRAEVFHFTGSSFFSHMDCAICVKTKISLLNQGHRDFLLFFNKSFTDLYLMFRPIIHFELIFMRMWDIFFIFVCLIFQQHLLKRWLFNHQISLPLCQK